VQVDLDAALYTLDQSAAYLRAKITSEKETAVVLDIYSDDGVKAWLNGKLIHENNADRGLVEPPDKVNVTLKRGDNELMLKVTDDIWGWGAMVRMRPAGSLASTSDK
jgi:hypothetical protein